ncbi:DUF6160 family protein, partial [Oleiphilus sp. HI0086]
MLFRVLIFMLTAGLANAEMSSIDDSDLSEVTGQSGVYLTGEVSINEEGGAFNDSDSHGYFGDCSN